MPIIYIMNQYRCFSLRNAMLLCAVFFICPGESQAQEHPLNKIPFPDSVKVILEKAFSTLTEGKIRYYSLRDWNNYEGLYCIDYWQLDTVTFTRKKDKDALLQILRDYETPREDIFSLLERFGIGKSINTLPDSAFSALYNPLHNGRYKGMLKWNRFQQQMLADSLRNPAIRGRLLEKYLAEEENEGISSKRYIVELYRKGEKILRYELSGRDFFRCGMEQFMEGRVDTRGKVPAITPYLYGMELLGVLVNDYADGYNASEKLYELGWHDMTMKICTPCLRITLLWKRGGRWMIIGTSNTEGYI